MSTPTTLTLDSDDHVLLRWIPDWNRKPDLRRRWLNEVSQAETQSEDRQSMRPKSLVSIRYLFAADYEDQRFQMMDDFLAAKESGLAVMPYWGRGTPLTEISNANLYIEDNNWSWAASDVVFLSDFDRASQTYETGTVFSTGTGQLTLNSSPSGSDYPFVWPLVFGKFTCGNIDVLNNEDGELEIEIEQRLPFSG